jgi:hypothetical protein
MRCIAAAAVWHARKLIEYLPLQVLDVRTCALEHSLGLKQMIRLYLCAINPCGTITGTWLRDIYRHPGMQCSAVFVPNAVM